MFPFLKRIQLCQKKLIIHILWQCINLGQFFSAGKYEVRQKYQLSNFHQGAFLRPKIHFEILFVCCHDLRNESKFYQLILSLNDYKTAGAGWGLPKEQGPHIKIK